MYDLNGVDIRQTASQLIDEIEKLPRLDTAQLRSELFSVNELFDNACASIAFVVNDIKYLDDMLGPNPLECG